ncbi:hypothetical protein [Methylibium sp.]|uniref:hypothetical protein n=1 Tax=Methylibium sp. TaxID=2067992 RepID=UPI00286AC264|nr:hypothetical protein [Methylibium sp.]
MRITIESPGPPDVLDLIDELDAYQQPLYPPESHHGIDEVANCDLIAWPRGAALPCRLDQLDVLLEQLIDELADLDAAGLGAGGK